jgi:hypothetical protein
VDDDRTEESRWTGRVAPGLRLLARQAAAGARWGARHIGPALAQAWRVAKPIVRSSLQILLALIIVFEEWGWRPLAELLGRLAQWRPWARVESAIARLPPYAALVVFALPTLLLLPLKLAAVFLIAGGHVVLAGLVFVAAKVVATALIARLFMLTQPVLMQIPWFAWAHDTAMPWKEALTERVRASWPWRAGRLWKERARRLAAGQWRRMRPAVLELQAAAAAAATAAVRHARLLATRTMERVKRRLDSAF